MAGATDDDAVARKRANPMPIILLFGSPRFSGTKRVPSSYSMTSPALVSKDFFSILMSPGCCGRVPIGNGDGPPR